MTPFEIGLSVFYAVIGITVPVLSIAGFKMLRDLLYEHILYMKHHRLYSNFMNPQYWFFRGYEQCPNPRMLSFKFENSASGEIISIGIDKDKLP